MQNVGVALGRGKAFAVPLLLVVILIGLAIYGGVVLRNQFFN